MATEDTPGSAILATDNWLFRDTVAIDSTPTTIPLYGNERLLRPQRTIQAWFEQNPTIDLIFDLGFAPADPPQFIAFVNSNIDIATTTNAVVEMDNDASFPENFGLVRWGFDTLAAPSNYFNKQQHFFLDSENPTYGDWSEVSNRNYLKIGFNATVSTGDELRIGAIWVGRYDTIRPDQGFRWGIRDVSDKTEAHGGAEYRHKRRPARTCDFDLRTHLNDIQNNELGISFADAYDMHEMVVENVGQPIFLVVNPGAAEKPRQLSSVYGTFDDRLLDHRVNWDGDNPLGFRVNEARG